MDDRTLARIAAVQTIYQNEVGGEAVGEVGFDGKQLAEINEVKRYNKKLLEKILTGLEGKREKIQELIEANLSDEWRYDRLDKLLVAILIAAISEILAGDLDKKIIISEYLSVTDSFYDSEKEMSFINAVLDKAAA